LMPLQQNTGKGLGATYLQMQTPFLEFFGGIDIDDTQIWVVPGYEDTIKDFLKQIKTPAILSYLKDPYEVSSIKAEPYIDRFELDLKKFENIQDFMQKNLDGKSRQRLINRINKIKKNYEVDIKECTASELPLLYKLSIQRFGERSSFNLPQRQHVLEAFLKRFNVDLFAIELDGKIAAMSYGIIFNNTYTTMTIGYDITIRDLSKYLIITQLERAMEKGCTLFDAGKGDNGWKSHFNFQKIPQYKLLLNI